MLFFLMDGPSSDQLPMHLARSSAMEISTPCTTRPSSKLAHSQQGSKLPAVKPGSQVMLVEMLASDFLRPSRSGIAPASHAAVRGGHDLVPGGTCQVSPCTLLKYWPMFCCCPSTAASITNQAQFSHVDPDPSLGIFPGSYNQLRKDY